MDISVFIFEKRNKILLLRNNDQWVLPGGMVLPGEREEDVLQKKVFLSVGRGIKNILKKLEGVFQGISPTMSCEIRASVFVGEIDLDGCEIPEDKRANVGWFSRKNIPILNLSDVAKSALNCYFTQTKGA